MSRRVPKEQLSKLASHSGRNGSDKHTTSTEILANRQLLNQIAMRDLAEEIADIENYSQIRELAGVGMGILPKTHYSSIINYREISSNFMMK